MADFPYLPLWTDAYLSDTKHLTPAEHGAYLLLLLIAWRSPDCALPNDDKFLGRAIGDPKGWPRLKPSVLAFWTLSEDNKWRQKRLSVEREKVAVAKKQKSAAGKANALKNHRRPCTNEPTEIEQNPQSRTNENKASIIISKDIDSEPIGSGTQVPDLAGKIFNEGLNWLVTASGRSNQSCRSFLGKCKSQNGDEAVIAAIGAAQRENAINPIAFIERRLGNGKRRSNSPSVMELLDQIHLGGPGDE